VNGMHRAIVLLLPLAAACGGGTRTPTIEVGACFDDAETDEIDDFAEVPCDGPHQNEVFLVFDVDDADDYPGTDALHDDGIERCRGQAFEGYVGEPYDASRYEVFTVVPTAESWSDGDREIVCALYDPEDNTESRSARAATA
jgi:hypothetical protein